VRADHVALRADAEQFALDGVEVAGRVQVFREDGVQRRRQPLAGPFAVDGQILHAVGNPDVGHAGRAERSPECGPDPAADDAVLDPELPDAVVAVAQRQPVLGVGMGEVRGVEVEPHAAVPGPVDPVLEVLGREVRPLDASSAGLGVAGVQVQPMRAGNKRERPIQVGPQLVRRAGFAGVVAGDGQSAADLIGSALEPAHVVPLPTVHRNGDLGEAPQRISHVHPPRSIHLPRVAVGRLDHLRWAASRTAW